MIKTDKEYREDNKKLIEEIESMDRELPHAYVLDNDEVVDLKPSEWRKFNKMKYRYTDSGKEVLGVKKSVILELLEMGDIEPVKEEDYIQEEQKAVLPKWL